MLIIDVDCKTNDYCALSWNQESCERECATIGSINEFEFDREYQLYR